LPGFLARRRHLATGHATGAIRIWDIATEKLIAALDGHRAASAASSIIRRRSLASASADADDPDLESAGPP